MAYQEFAPRVAESSATTGTGAITLDGAVPSYVRFSTIAGLTVGDTLPYYVVDDTEAWEFGIGTYSAANTLTRTTRLASSTGSAINLSGTQIVFMSYPGAGITFHSATAKTTMADADELGFWDSVSGLLRKITWANLVTALRAFFTRVLSADLDLYVDAATGNDGNDGSIGAPFATIQRALNELLSLTLNKWSVSIHVADGDYSGEDLTCFTSQVDQYGYTVYLVGNVTTKANVTVNSFYGYLSNVQLSGITFLDSVAVGSGYVEPVSVTAKTLIAYPFGYVGVFDDFTFSGDAGTAVTADQGLVRFNRALAFSGNTYSFAIVYATRLSSVVFGGTPVITGTAVGRRYIAEKNGIIDTEGGSGTYIPGDVAGITSSGGQYI